MKLRTSYSIDFFSVDQTNVIKGIAIFFVFFNHLINGYLLHAVDSLTLPLDGLFVFVDEQLTQLMVGLFLFMSGYGVYESFKRKGWKYIQSIPKKRIANTIINFDIAVLIYLVVAILIGTRYDIKQIALSFFAWESVGNSNWYIFAILYCYIITYISFNILKNRSSNIIMVIVLSFVYILLMSIMKEGQTWWYSTILCYSFGLLYSKNKNNIDVKINNKYWVSLICCAVVFCVTYLFSGNFYFHNISACFYCLLWVIVSMKISINSKMLKWCGENLFPLYIYQRIPMSIIENACPQLLQQPYTHIYVILCILVTFVIAKFYPLIKVELS